MLDQRRRRLANIKPALVQRFVCRGEVFVSFTPVYKHILSDIIKFSEMYLIKVTLSYGVPQGSVLGSVLFTLYTTPISTIISSFDINHHLYADDIQIDMSLSVSNAKESICPISYTLFN